MHLKHLWMLLLIAGVSAAESEVLSRKRRYLSFPEGSSFAASVCLTIGVIGNPVLEYMSWAINWGIAYDLPNQTWVRQHAHGFSNKLDAVTSIRHRHRRDLYEKVEVAMDSMGFNGRECIGRALCESANYFSRRKGNMVEEIIKALLSFPNQRKNLHADPNAHHYDKAYSRGRVDANCEKQYPNCHISLLGLALGEYSVEPTKHGTPGALGFM